MSNQKTPRPESLYGNSKPQTTPPPVPKRKESLPTPGVSNPITLTVYQAHPSSSTERATVRFGPVLYSPAIKSNRLSIAENSPSSPSTSSSVVPSASLLIFSNNLNSIKSNIHNNNITATRMSQNQVEPMNTEAYPTTLAPSNSAAASNSTTLNSNSGSSLNVSSCSSTGTGINNPGLSQHIFEAKNLHRDSFKALYEFYQNGQLCDVEIQVGRRNIKCHKVVLACVSRYFRTMFSSEMKESRSSVIPIKDMDESAMKLLIDFAYTSKVLISIDNVQSLLYASSILQTEILAQACCDFMKNHLDANNCIGVRNFAEQHGRSELVRKTDQYVLSNFAAVVASSEYLTISAKYLETLISSTDLNVRGETEVYEAVIKWIKFEKDERKQYANKLMQNVRLPLLPAQYLVHTVCKEDIMRTDFGCRDLIDEAKLYHMSMSHVVPNLTLSKKLLPRKSCAGVVFCVGGRGSSGDPFKSIECYDVRRDRWFPVADMSTKRRHVGVVSAEGLLFAIGGHDGTEHLNSGEVFDPKDNKWKPISPMTTLRRGLAVASLTNGPIYALGGLDDSTCYNTVERYDSVSDTWSFVEAMNVPRGGVAVSAIKGQLYAVGGNDGAASLDSCEKYDPHLNKWTMMANMNKRRAGAGCAELGGILYVVGGFDDNAPLDSVEKFDPVNNTWVMIKKMSCPRGGVGVAALGGQIYAVGGHDGTNYLNSVEAYDPISDCWEAIGSISACRAGAGVSYCDSNLEDIINGVQSSEILMSSPKVNNCV